MGACAGKNSPQSSTLAAAGKQKKTVLSDHLKMGEQSLKPAFEDSNGAKAGSIL
jgi:hypothetical protein